MDIDKVITRRLNEIDNQSKISKSSDRHRGLFPAPQRLSNGAWQKRASEKIKELV